VPNVVGMSEAAAVTAIEGVGLVPSVTFSSHASVPAGNVISQSPSTGAQVPGGATVQISVSTGPVQFALPNVGDETEADALEILDDLGLDTTVSTENSSVVDAGTVIRTEPAAGTMMIVGDDVTVVVSLGPI